MSVWAVVYGNYHPAEVLALYDNEAAAREHAGAEQDANDDMLEVQRWSLRSRYRPEPAP